MIQIPAAFAPAFMTLFFLAIVGSMVWILISMLRHPDAEPVPTLVPWRPGYAGRLQMDGRWSSSASAFQRKMECVLYAPQGRSGHSRAMPRAARFSHTVRALGPWVLEASTRLETHHHEIDLEARNYLELLPQLGLLARRWTVSIDGVAIGTLSRRDGAIVARNNAGEPIGTWIAPSPPGRLRDPAPSEAEARKPWYTPLEILGTHLQLRLPFFDGRQHPYDFAGIPFIDGTVPENAAVEDWSLAFVALSSQAALALRIATPRRSTSPVPRDIGNRTGVML
jgi:hypothetical protein